MKKALIFLLFLAVVGFALLVGGKHARDSGHGSTTRVTRGTISVSAVYEGVIDSRTVRPITSDFSGNATIVWLIAEGSYVKAGDTVLQLDSAAILKNLVGLEEECSLAECDLTSLENAKLPLELSELQSSVAEARATLLEEQGYLKSTEGLLSDDLVSVEEFQQQEEKVANAARQLESAELKLSLTKEYLHPTALTRARSTLEAARRKLALARTEVDLCTVRAPIDGIVIYQPLHIGGEYRTVRVGDEVFQNQPLMVIGDMGDLIVRCNVPEVELPRVDRESPAMVAPLAYPGLRMAGVVESVSSMAGRVPGLPEWQKYFQVIVGMNENDPRLRLGMSVHVHILSYLNEDALTVPRKAITWVGDWAFCVVVVGDQRERRRITVGKSDEVNYEVLDGLTNGDAILLD